MKKITTLISVMLLSGLIANSAFAAQDYNSSRSNKSSVVDSGDEVDNLLKRASNDAQQVAKRLVDLETDAEDRVQVTVEIRVKVEKLCQAKEDPTVCSVGEVECVCSHL